MAIVKLSETSYGGSSTPAEAAEVLYQQTLRAVTLLESSSSTLDETRLLNARIQEAYGSITEIEDIQDSI